MRIFAPMKTGPTYWLIHALIWGNLVLYTVILFITIFQCAAVDNGYRNPFYNGHHCISPNAEPIISGVFNVVSDLLNLLLPLWSIWKLQMASKRKAGTIAIFATGSMCVIPLRSFPHTPTMVGQATR